MKIILFFLCVGFVSVTYAEVDPATRVEISNSRSTPDPAPGTPPRPEMPAPRSAPEAERPQRVLSREESPQLLSAKPSLSLKGDTAPQEAEDPLVISHEWLVTSATQDAANIERDQLEAFGLKLKSRQWLPNLGFVLSVYQLPLNANAKKLLEQVLSKHPGMQIEFNRRYPLLEASNKHYGFSLTGASESGCSRQGDTAFTGVVAMMDSRVNARLPQLKNSKLKVQDLAMTDDSASSDHGTAIAVLLVQLLPKAQIFAINVYKEVNGPNGKTLETQSDWLISGFEAVLAHQPQPIALNMSFGGSATPLLQRVVNKMDQRGIRLVAAAGNGGRQARPVYPAAYESVRAVSAVDIKEKLWAGSNRGEYIAYAAPGVDVWLPNAQGKNRFVSGTSYAAPWVTAAAALATDKQWKKPASLARDLGKTGRDSDYGYGLVQLGSLCR